MHINKKRAGAIVGATVVGLAGAGVAFAYWTSTGQGTGSAATGTVTLSASVTGVSGLYPGASVPASVVLTNDNTSNTAMKIQSVTAGTTSVSGGKGSCDPSVVTFTPTTTLPTTTSTAPGADFTVDGNVTMTMAAADGCQGASFSIPLTATGRTS